MADKNFLENARQHFINVRTAPKPKITVPEWDAEFYVRKLNLAETSDVEIARQKSPKDGIVKSLMLRCVDENGEPVFKAHHERILSKEVDPEILSRIAVEIIAHDRKDEKSSEEIEKN